MSERFGQDLLLVERLAAGGMAEVYRAKQLGVGGFEKTIALKRILPNFAQNEEFKFMFRQEANLCANLNHPNIVQVFSNGEFEGYLYLIMEFVDGRNLRQLLARADKKKLKIPPEIACFVCLEAAKGLEYAHAFKDERTGQPMDIVHRDISPQNVMLSYDGGVKIVDFGIAKAAAQAENTRAGVLKGKFGYMSPEQASGMKIDRRTDVFALGIILFETLTQRRLFTCDDDMRTLNLVRQAKVPRPSKYNPEIGPQLDRIVLKALARERAERYATAADLYKDLLLFMNQKYPKFIPTELAEFLRSVFAEDIEEDRKRREKWAAEAPARTVDPATAKAAVRSPDDKDATRIEQDEATQISQVGAAPDLPPAFASGDFSPAQGGRVDSQVVATPELNSATATDHSADPAELPAPLTYDSRIVTPELTGNHLAPSPKSPPRPPTISRVELSQAGYVEAATRVGIPMPAPRRRSKRVLVYGGLVAGLLLALGLIGQEAAMKPATSPDPVEVVAETPKKPVPEVVEAPPPAAEEVAAVEEPVAVETAPPSVAAAPDEPATPPVEAPPVKAQEMVRVQAPATREPSAVAVVAKPEAGPGAAPPVSASNDARKDLPGRSGLPGFLTLRSTPRATEVYVDGEMLRDANKQPLATPIERHRLSPGRHVIVLKNPVYGIEHREEIAVESDRLLQRDILMRRSPASSP